VGGSTSTPCPFIHTMKPVVRPAQSVTCCKQREKERETFGIETVGGADEGHAEYRRLEGRYYLARLRHY
jgi:hypothetical protein